MHATFVFAFQCQGLGATSVKCSTEHYTVMEHVLTCFETVPYFFATPISFNPYFLQGETCAELDNTLFTPADIQIDSQDSLDQLPPNDNTNLVDVAKSTDYSLTKKDDGKVLYRWGSLIKRPNDVRLYARLALPDEWKEEDADYTVTKAILIVDHWITNNPNDQLRAEDLENEGATGRKPSYEITDNGNWVSTRECYEGDGDFIGIEDEGDPTVLDIGTVFKRPSIPEDYFTLQGDSPPLPFSKDLKEYFTNAWYTSINRDPFEWSYRNTSKGDNVFDFIGSPGPLIDEELELVSGPRWRLKANKFGQDLPGLEIPLEECSAPPFTNDNIKYRVGERVETIINLLDWDKDETSPLATSTGWVDVTANDGVVVNDIVDGVPVTTNGCPMSDDFDLAVYIKGDRKPTAIFSARLEISYVSAIGSPMEADFAIVSYGLQTSGPRALGEKSTKSKRKSNVVTLGEEVTIFWVIHNLGTAGESSLFLLLLRCDKSYELVICTAGLLTLIFIHNKASNGTTSANCQDNRGRNYNLVPNPIVFRIDAGGEYEARATFTPIGSRTLKFSCSLTTSPTSEGVSDTNLENNIVENFRFKAKKKRSKK